LKTGSPYSNISVWKPFIRDVDIVTQYNRQQFLVNMLEADPSGVNTAVDRIFKNYFRMSGSMSSLHPIPSWGRVNIKSN